MANDSADMDDFLEEEDQPSYDVAMEEDDSGGEVEYGDDYDMEDDDDDENDVDYDANDIQCLESGSWSCFRSDYPPRRIHATLVDVYRNDPSVTMLTTTNPNAWLDLVRLPLGRALVSNTHVVSLKFDACAVYPANRRHDNKNGELLCTFIRQSPVLRSVSMTNSLDDEELDGGQNPFVSRFLKAVADNPRLEYVELEEVLELPSRPIIRLLETTQALQTLKILNCTFRHDDGNLDRTLPQALSRCPTLKCLCILVEVVISKDFSTNLLMCLGDPQSQQHSSLTELSLVPCGRDARSQNRLDRALCSALSLNGLESLTFEYTFNRASMELFLQALQSHTTGSTGTTGSTSPTKPLETLRLVSCTMDDEAAQLFVQHMQTTSVPQVLRMDCHGILDFGTWTPGDMASMAVRRQTAATDVAPHPHPPLPMARLHLENDEADVNLADFYTNVRVHATDVRVHTLQVDRLAAANFEACMQCLSELLYVRELDIASVGLRIYLDWERQTNPNQVYSTSDVVNALRQNGSLYRVSLGRMDHQDNVLPLLNEMQRRLVDSFGERNRLVPAILARPTFEDELPDSYAVAVNEDANVAVGNANDEDMEELFSTWRLFPPLFASVLPSPRTTPNSVLIGLIALDESI